MRRPRARPEIPVNDFISRPRSSRFLRWAHEHVESFHGLPDALSGRRRDSLCRRRKDVAATASVLSQLEGRSPAVPRGRGKDGDAATTGSPLIDGSTVTVGGANLLQRVAGSI